MIDRARRSAAAPATYCVTGATGYLGSWLIKLLLQKGYTVHATARDPVMDPMEASKDLSESLLYVLLLAEKALPLLAPWRGGDGLRLFRADLQEQGSFNEALRGCAGVFHLAASMQFNVQNPINLEDYVESKIIHPVIRGTDNLLESCSKSGSVKRVVFTSSISTTTAKDSSGEWRQVVDESCQTPVELVWKTKASGWVYVLSKLSAENAAFRVAGEKGIDLVSVITTTVGGPFLTSNVPSSIKTLLSPVTGDSELFPILSAVNSRMGSIALVHIEDICNAHIFLMEEPKAQGKYICCSCSCPMPELIDLLIRKYRSSDINRLEAERQHSHSVSVPSEISSKKLRDLGFSYKHGLEDIVNDTIKACLDHGFLPSPK